jgi:asparagine synthase (glutamine-hydrolysing)
MCGIAGFLATGNARPGVELLLRMGGILAHRGPDASGEWLSADGKAGLSHRRLSILDLSEAGAQPMAGPTAPRCFPTTARCSTTARSARS